MAAERPQKSRTDGSNSSSNEPLDVAKYRVNATLALINGNLTTGYLVQIKEISKTGVQLFSKIAADEGTDIRVSVDGLDSASMDGQITTCASAEFDAAAPPGHAFKIAVKFTPKDERARDAQLVSCRYLAKIAGQSY